MSLDRDIALLSRIPLFNDLATEHLRLLAFSAVRSELLADQILFREGTAANSGFVLSSGSIELSTGIGKAKTVLQHCEPGTLIGEMALFVETRRPATAMATSHAELFEISRALIVRMLNEYPQVALRFRAKISERLTATIGELGRVRQELNRQSRR
jgi:CRP-like cAMP-binding protein